MMDADLAFVWSYHQTIEDLKHKLLTTTLELETLRSNAKDEIKKSQETVNQLLQMLKAVTKERDEARQQLQLLLSKIKQPSKAEVSPFLPHLQPDSPKMRQTGGNSSITVSDNLSGTLNHHSYGSSPIESIFDVVNSPEFSSMNMSDSCNMSIAQQPKLSDQNKIISSNTLRHHDQASAIIDSLAMNKPLPEKGKLLQAVQEAGPLLQNLLLAGPLPQWRTPPSLQPLYVPPLSVKARSSATVLNQSAFPLVSFPGASSGFAAAKRSVNSTCISSFGNSAKHQRIH